MRSSVDKLALPLRPLYDLMAKQESMPAVGV